MKLSYRKRKSMYGYIFILPWVLGVMLFFLVPFFESIFYSFNTLTIDDIEGFVTKADGLRYFRYMFRSDPEFIEAFVESLVSIAYTAPLIVMFSLLMGVLLNIKFRGRILFRAVFFLPVIVTSGVVLQILQADVNSSLMLGSASYNSKSMILNITILNDLLAGLGADTAFANTISKIVSETLNTTWYSGVQILLIIAGLQGISTSVYEAARIEGASKWDEFWKITFPMLQPVIFVTIIYTVIDSFTSTRNPVMKVISSNAFNNFNYSYACAISIVYCLAILAIIGLVSATIGRSSANFDS